MILKQCDKMEVNETSMPQVSLPKGWELRLLGELATIFSGGTPNRKNPEYWDGDIPWVTTTLIDGGEIFEANEFITQKGLKGSSAKWCKAGTILMAMYGQGKTRGKVALLGIDATINQACAAIELSELCSKEYVLYLLISKYEQIRELSNSGGQENLSSRIIRNLEVPLPPQKEQIIIANVLSDTNALITELEQLIAKKQAIKTATMQQLLTGRTRLSQFAKHPDGSLKGFTSSELGVIPEDWIISPLSQMGHVLRGVSYNGSRDLYPHDTEDSVRLFRSNNIHNSKVDLANLQYVTKNRVAYHQLMNGGDILICMANGSKSLVGKAAIYNIEDGHKYTFGAFMGVFRTFAEVESLYAFYLLTSDRCRSYLDLALAGSSINNLKPSDIEQFTFALPNSEEQKAIVTILSDMDAELETLEKKLSKARDIKQGMMQQLLTGRIRLPLDQQP